MTKIEIEKAIKGNERTKGGNWQDLPDQWQEMADIEIKGGLYNTKVEPFFMITKNKDWVGAYWDICIFSINKEGGEIEIF